MRNVGFSDYTAEQLLLSPPIVMELCPVFRWENDGQDGEKDFQIRSTVNGELSLGEARDNSRPCGIAHPCSSGTGAEQLPDEQ